jgi:hypothetical protein
MAEFWQRPGEAPSSEARLSVVSRFAQDPRLGPANFL